MNKYEVEATYFLELRVSGEIEADSEYEAEEKFCNEIDRDYKGVFKYTELNDTLIETTEIKE